MYHFTNTSFTLSKSDLIKLHYPNLLNGSYKEAGWEFDYSIPQTWVDRVLKELPDIDAKTMFMFVWLYEPDNFMGEPLPLTKKAQDVLKRLNKLEEEQEEYLKDTIERNWEGETK
jgi:hypothetical protein